MTRRSHRAEPTYHLVGLDHCLLLLKLLEQVGERLFHGAQICAQLVFLFHNLLELSFGKFLLFLSLILKRERHTGLGGSLPMGD